MQTILVAAAIYAALVVRFCFSAPPVASSDGAASVGAGTASPPAVTGEQDTVNGENGRPTHQILCLATGKYLAITRSGRVSGKNPKDRQVTEFYLSYLESNDHRTIVKIKSFKYCENNWYVTLNDRKRFRGGVPLQGNEQFEYITVQNHFVLKAQYMPMANRTETPSQNSNSTDSDASGFGSGSGSGAAPELRTTFISLGQRVDDCYLGFDSKGQPSCYDSEFSPEVALQLINVTPPSSPPPLQRSTDETP